MKGTSKSEELDLSQDLVTVQKGGPGTVGYQAPEIKKGKEGDFKSDVYSLGITLFEMLAGRKPELQERPTDVNDALPEELDQLYRAMVMPSRMRRIDPATLIERIEKCNFMGDFESFDHYHEWYTGKGLSDYDTVFPVILSDCDECIEDGWHRFHLYIDKGIDIIPFVEYI